jgi:hypothetical protein
MHYIPTLPPDRTWQTHPAGRSFLQEAVSAVPWVGGWSSADGPSTSGEGLRGSPDRALEDTSLDKGFWRRGGTVYERRAHIAIEEICTIATPKGLIGWLRENSPFFYRRLTDELPNEISRAWTARVSSEYFDNLCFELVVTYKRAVEMRQAGR